jgi:hypothetical protein
MPSIERMQRLRMFAVSLLAAILSLPLAVSALGCVLYFLHCLETENRVMGKAVKRLSTPRQPVQHESAGECTPTGEPSETPSSGLNLARASSLKSR